MPSVRDSLISELQKVLGADVHVIPFQDAMDVADRKTVMVKQQTIQKATEAPMANLRIDYILTFISPATAPAIAEAELDVWVPETLDELRMDWFNWTTATKALHGSTNLCYDVECYVLTRPANPPREDADGQ